MILYVQYIFFQALDFIIFQSVANLSIFFLNPLFCSFFWRLNGKWRNNIRPKQFHSFIAMKSRFSYFVIIIDWTRSVWTLLHIWHSNNACANGQRSMKRELHGTWFLVILQVLLKYDLLIFMQNCIGFWYWIIAVFQWRIGRAWIERNDNIFAISNMHIRSWGEFGSVASVAGIIVSAFAPSVWFMHSNSFLCCVLPHIFANLFESVGAVLFSFRSLFV